MLTIIIVILADLIGFSLLVPIYYNISDLQVGYFVQIWAASLCLGAYFWRAERQDQPQNRPADPPSSVLSSPICWPLFLSS